MLYAYQLRAHSNARYQDSLLPLSKKELSCMLHACGLDVSVDTRILGGAPFLCFEADTLTPAQTAFLGGHSGLYMTCALEGDLLRPLEPAPVYALPADMPEILKYKGKTNASFTHLMINLALSAGSQWRVSAPRVFDPICGRGTSLYCALTRGMHAIGVDTDHKALTEGVTYAQKWLQYHRVKHTVNRSGMTLGGGKKNAPLTRISVHTPEKDMDLSFLQADTRDSALLIKKQKAHALVADLPYGVQHAPSDHGQMSSLETLLRESLPAWRQSLHKGCAAAIAFNTYTLRRDVIERLALEAGFTLPDPALYGNFEHWVEQAVNRDVVVLINPD